MWGIALVLALAAAGDGVRAQEDTLESRIARAARGDRFALADLPKTHEVRRILLRLMSGRPTKRLRDVAPKFGSKDQWYDLIMGLAKGPRRSVVGAHVSHAPRSPESASSGGVSSRTQSSAGEGTRDG